MAKPRVRCPVCRMWIDCSPGATKVPQHKEPVDKQNCNGSGKSPAGTRGPGWK